MFVRILWTIGVAIAGTATWLGMPYYLTPVDERPFSAMHDLYAPTGLVGHGFGIIGSLLVVVGVTLYMLRKRARFLARVGKLRDWLHFHIFLCLLGPYLVLLHTTFRFGGFVAISFWSMAAVVGSGVFGRYVYSWIPKTISGGFVGVAEIRERMEGLLLEVQGSAGLSADRLREIVRPPPEPASGPSAPEPMQATGAGTEDRRKSPRPSPDRRKRDRQPGIFRAVGEAVTFRLSRRRRRVRFDRELSAAGVPTDVRSELVHNLDEECRVELQLHVLQPFQRAFRYWHAFHLPLALVMFVVLAGHVAVAVMFGYTWIF